MMVRAEIANLKSELSRLGENAPGGELGQRLARIVDDLEQLEHRLATDAPAWPHRRSAALARWRGLGQRDASDGAFPYWA